MVERRSEGYKRGVRVERGGGLEVRDWNLEGGVSG